MEKAFFVLFLLLFWQQQKKITDGLRASITLAKKEPTQSVCACVCDTIPPTPYEGREVVAMVAAIGAWRKWEGEAGSKQ